MPSIRKRVYGLIRTTFSPSQSVDDDTYDTTAQTQANSNGTTATSGGGSGRQHSFIGHYLHGRLKRINQPEVYSGKTGVDLPVIHLEAFSKNVFASYTGPDGGLTEVSAVSKRPIVNIANLDDELSLSCDGDDLDDELRSISYQRARRKTNADDDTTMNRSYCSLIDGCADTNEYRTCYSFDWTKWHDRAYGLSTSLYERHPLTGVHAGHPVADVFAIIARDNCCFMALADGVNWGDRSRLAARCAVRGAIDHLNERLIDGVDRNTEEVFHCLLGAFHAGHQLILQEGGTLTTLCVVVVAKLAHSDAWAVCCCNVGDSLCFVYSKTTGVREVTLGSHDIAQMRDMRDAGGALGPVDGVNPELQNLTCSMTFIDQDDLVFITSDGVSDNFDPVVGKFCVINKKTTTTDISKSSPKKQQSIGNCQLTNGNCNKTTTNDNGGFDDDNGEKLPYVEAHQRHELMLLRMEDLLTNGMGDDETPRCLTSAAYLCDNLVNFARQLSMCKRRTLEDPELYLAEQHMTLSEQRHRRKLIRSKISDMPGKLDHATVVAYQVGIYNSNTIDQQSSCDVNSINTITTHIDVRRNDSIMKAECDAIVEPLWSEISDKIVANITSKDDHSTNFDGENEMIKSSNDICNDFTTSVVISSQLNLTSLNSTVEVVQVSDNRLTGRKKKKHERGSTGRHTLSVDVGWLKRLVGERTSRPIQQQQQSPITNTIRQRLRNLSTSIRSSNRHLLANTPQHEQAVS